MLAALSRIAFFVILFIFTFNRLDYSVYPEPFYSWDTGFAAFNGMLFLDHYHNNPILLVFSKTMKEILIPKYTTTTTTRRQALTQLSHKLQTAILLKQNPSLQKLTRRGYKIREDHIRTMIEKMNVIYETTEWKNEFTEKMKNLLPTLNQQ